MARERPSEPVRCPRCEKAVAPRGLAGHQRLAHPGQPILKATQPRVRPWASQVSTEVLTEAKSDVGTEVLEQAESDVGNRFKEPKFLCPACGVSHDVPRNVLAALSDAALSEDDSVAHLSLKCSACNYVTARDEAQTLIGIRPPTLSMTKQPWAQKSIEAIKKALEVARESPSDDEWEKWWERP